MATYQCPKGHTSTDPDYCSECGVLIGQTTMAKLPAVTAATTAGAAVCPDCMTPRTPGARYCEVCRHEFDAAPPAVLAASGAAAPLERRRARPAVRRVPWPRCLRPARQSRRPQPCRLPHP